jgi:hypothetical protein
LDIPFCGYGLIFTYIRRFIMNTYEKIEGVLNKIGSNCSAIELQQNLLLTINSITSPYLLLDILNNESHLDFIAAQSYMHYNGFYKIPLINVQNVKLRLHYWNSLNNESFEENIHDHRWDFSSLILLGGYTNEIFAEDNDGSEYEEYHYYPRENKQSYQLSYVKNSKLILDRCEQITKGDCIIFPKGCLHRVKPVVNNNTVSIFLQGKVQASYARVLNKIGVIDKSETIPAQSICKNKLKDILLSIYQQLNEG